MTDLRLPPLYHASTGTMDVCSDSMPPTPLSADLSIPCIYPFLSSLGRLPRWFLLAYFFTGYLGVVGRKEWPHFFRFHVVSLVTGMLLEILLQVVGIVYRWLPHGFYWERLGCISGW